MFVDFNGCPAIKYFVPVRSGVLCEYIRNVKKVQDAIHQYNANLTEEFLYRRLKINTVWSKDGENCVIIAYNNYDWYEIEIIE